MKKHGLSRRGTYIYKYEQQGIVQKSKEHYKNYEKGEDNFLWSRS